MARSPSFAHLLGSKWTACQPSFGWRHFRVITRQQDRQQRPALLYAELVAACDPSVRFWLDARLLKNRDLWKPGWLTLDELTALDENAADRGNEALG